MIKGFQEIQFFLGKKNEGVPRRFSLGGFADLLVAFRNKTKAHGAIQSDLAIRMNPILETSIKAFLKAMPFLNQYDLGIVQGSPALPPTAISTHDPACPSEGQFYVLDPAGVPLFSLYPAAIWKDSDFGFLNGWEGPSSVEYLSYSSGQILRNSCEKIYSFFGPKPVGNSFPTGPLMQIEIARKDVWDLSVDVAIMAQDLHRVFGPVQDIQTIENPNVEISKTIDAIEEKENLSMIAHGKALSRNNLYPLLDFDFDSAVLGQPFFGDVQRRHDLDSGNDRSSRFFGGHHGRCHDPILAKADAKLFFHGLYMNVRNAVLYGLADDEVAKTNGGGVVFIKILVRIEFTWVYFVFFIHDGNIVHELFRYTALSIVNLNNGTHTMQMAMFQLAKYWPGNRQINLLQVFRDRSVTEHLPANTFKAQARLLDLRWENLKPVERLVRKEKDEIYHAISLKNSNHSEVEKLFREIVDIGCYTDDLLLLTGPTG